ncbi:MAG: hypothetical protein QNJ73_02155 [Gammaproteobacteria bacterium]|nr:hypothetical protein [Gammaproteobacteria bacterium]
MRQKREREEAARDAEPKDSNWAYETEQLLEQFMVAQPEATDIDITAIDCRTSFCEVRASGPIEAWNNFGELVKRATREPWSTFGAGLRTNSSGQGATKTDFRAIIERDASRYQVDTELASDPVDSDGVEEDCLCATPQWSMRRLELEDSARAAEGKDDYWAYEKEQALQLFIAGHRNASSFEVTEIDCRTTYCKITAVGRAEQSVDHFSEVFHDPALQERLGFTAETEVGSSGHDDVFELDARVMRQ